MSDDSFLLKAFFGQLDIDQLRIFRDIEPDDNTRELAQRFLEIRKEYPATDLDEQGVIPPKAMDRLKQIGFFGLNVPVELAEWGSTCGSILNWSKRSFPRTCPSALRLWPICRSA